MSSGSTNQLLTLRGRYFLLTYPRSDFNHAHAWIQLNERGACGAIVCSELHQDDTEHRHIAVDFGRRRQFSNAHHTFNITLGDTTWTGNYQTARSWAAIRHYVEKDGNVSYFGTSEPNLEQANPETETEDIIDALTRTQSYAEWLVWTIKQKISFGHANALWQELRGNRPATLLEGDNIPGNVVLPELQLRTFSQDTNRALVLLGPSGVGKTTWAKLNIPKPALLVSHIDDLKHFKVGVHKGIIFDDMHFAGDENGKGAWPRTSQIHLVDFENPRSIHCRHRCATIPAGVFKIFTCNVYPFSVDPAIERRIYLITLNFLQ
ncbi:replication-associated protein [Arctopus echinatus-associated virus]|uniref:Replication-associated protein n=1 Tax=Arctopus echinatus-associated virus TaxID=2282642 RepID=A0A345BKA2_9VIRU|nr:replication-associated protein [Arctopus echinatus-associated virus]AXF50873.1 replication-associated protein [Arctopus echinatus-associated virus]